MSTGTVMPLLRHYTIHTDNMFCSKTVHYADALKHSVPCGRRIFTLYIYCSMLDTILLRPASFGCFVLWSLGLRSSETLADSATESNKRAGALDRAGYNMHCGAPTLLLLVQYTHDKLQSCSTGTSAHTTSTITYTNGTSAHTTHYYMY